MSQIPFYQVSNHTYIGVVMSTGEDMLHIVRPSSGYLAIGSVSSEILGEVFQSLSKSIQFEEITQTKAEQSGGSSNFNPVSTEDVYKEVAKYTCIDYESGRTKANQSFSINYPEGIVVVILSNHLPTFATTMTGETNNSDSDNDDINHY